MKKTALAAMVGALALGGCIPDDNSGANKEARATKQILDQAAVTVGVPAIKNFTEKRQLKMLYELRDNANLVTYSYFVDMTGNLHKVCPATSVGYGMPFSAQFTSPRNLQSNRPLRPDGDSSTLHIWEAPQPEPNGIYMPDSTSATWVICLSSDGKSLKPVYVEPQIIVSLEPMSDQ